MEVGVGKEGSLEEKHLERSSKAGEGGRWDMSAKYEGLSIWNTVVGFGPFT